MKPMKTNGQDFIIDQICQELEEIGACYWRMFACWKALDPDKHKALREKFFAHFLTNAEKSFLGKTKALVASWRSKPKPEEISRRALESHRESERVHRRLEALLDGKTKESRQGGEER
jgi:hypothetical protein